MELGFFLGVITTASIYECADILTKHLTGHKLQRVFIWKGVARVSVIGCFLILLSSM